MQNGPEVGFMSSSSDELDAHAPAGGKAGATKNFSNSCGSVRT